MDAQNGTRVDELPGDIHSLLNEAIADFQQKRQEVEDARNRIAQIVSKHNTSRFDLLFEKWEKDDLGWCTKCEKVVAAGELKLILTWGKECYEHGYGNSYYGYQGFQYLHRACIACQEKILARNGWYGEWNSSAKSQENFFARYADVEDPEIENLSFKNRPDFIDDDLAAKWGIPPEIVNSQGHLHVAGTGIPSFAEIRGY